MVTLEFRAEELEVLTEELAGRLTELESELAHTDRKEFRQMLKGRKAIMESILGRLRRAPVEA